MTDSLDHCVAPVGDARVSIAGYCTSSIRLGLMVRINKSLMDIADKITRLEIQ